MVCWTAPWGVAIGNPVDSPPNQDLVLAQDAYDKGNFPKVLELIAPIIKENSGLPAAQRLKMLSLAHLGKTAEGLNEYDQFIKKSGREDEALLRQLAIASILPLRTDMREQMRGAAYTALKEIQSEEIVPYFEEGLADGSGMVRALVAEGLGKFSTGRASKKFHQALQDQAGWVRATVIKALGRSGDKAYRFGY